jgi:uncharacterized membrane protein
MLSRYVMLALRVGMYASLVLLALGTVIFLATGGQNVSALMPFEAVSSALRGEAIGFLSLGIFCLIATPLAGAMAALLAFLQAGERRMILVCLAVLGVVALAIIARTIA